MSEQVRQGLFVLGLCTLACITMLTYALASGAAQSIFISTYGSTMLPWAWLAVALGSAMVSWAVQTASRRTDLVRLFSASCFLSALTLTALLLAHRSQLPFTSFILYVWKDVYIIVLVELFWTFANVAFGLRQAPRTYGYFCAAGSLGSVLGGLCLGPLASTLGTANTMWLILPMLALLGVGTTAIARFVAAPKPQADARLQAAGDSPKLWQNRYLLSLGALVAIVQAMITLTEFRFSTMLELYCATEADRTHLIGLVSAITNTLSFAVQLLSAQIFALFGLQHTLQSLPLMMGVVFACSVGAVGPVPTSACLIAGKTIDYSLFRAAKEMLYIPLRYAEKTRGKAFVDIFIYRLARGGASLLLLALSRDRSQDARLALTSVVLAVLWMLSMRRVLRLYRGVLQARV